MHLSNDESFFNSMRPVDSVKVGIVNDDGIVVPIVNCYSVLYIKTLF